MRRGMATLGVAACLLMSCGDDSDGSAASTQTTRRQPATSDAADGEPLLFGIYTPADNPTFTAPELIPAAQAAVRYVNEERGGIGGRPIELVSCTTAYTPESLTTCAQDLFRQQPLLIIPGPDASAFTAFNVFADAGIPLIGGASFTPPEYTSDLRVLFNGWSATLFPAMVHFAADALGANEIVAVTFDDGLNPALIDVFMDPITRAKGLPDVEFVPTQPGTADFTSSLAAAVAADPDAILAYGVPCVPLIRAYAGLGTNIPLVQPSNCNDPRTLDAAGDAADGAYYVNQFRAPATHAADDDVALLLRILETYGEDDIAITDFSSTGVASILNIERVLDDADVSAMTPADIVAAFTSLTDAPNFLGEPYTCRPAPVEQWPSICSGSAFLTNVEDGELRAVGDFVSMTSLYDAS